MPPARKGYAGTMILYKEGMEAKKSYPRIGAPDTMDDEGRLLTLEFDDFYFVNVYTPNAGDGLKRLKERQEWDIQYANYLSRSLPVVILMWHMRKSTSQIRREIICRQVLQMRRERGLQISCQRDSWTPSAIFMGM